ncbi:hypothetical protein MTR67_024496 [Solanum verrucosum]|uniref:RING-type E3 ubiquitin transferase n=1 Tax=Solanum verrucosum TaxID=315347 RepID=A0AAF0QX37_SOLVR|nr:hypothetical protein MTR67_024496 [Solanum verrucosum]
MYAIAQTEAIDTSRKKLRVEEANKLKQINLKEEEAKELAEQEKLKCEAARKKADYAMECVEREAEQRRAAESIANREARTKEKLEKSLALPITTTVKVLYSAEAHRTKQFPQELEVLSKIHHPHLLFLLGACPERGCLVYEYMENGSLEDRLTRKNNTPPLTWFDRVRIVWEFA